MMDVAQDIYLQAQKAKDHGGSPTAMEPVAPKGRKRHAGLKVRDPW